MQEIRIHTGTEHRVLYVAKFAEAVYVLHAFQKKSRKTARVDIDLARRRFAALIEQLVSQKSIDEAASKAINQLIPTVGAFNKTAPPSELACC